MTSLIKQKFPLGFQWPVIDPFLFCVHHLDHYPKGDALFGPSVSLAGRNIGQDFEEKDGFRMYHGQHVPGFPVHPHRGFETVTVVRKGFVDHSDSLGAAGRYGEGDTQWMTAGNGVQHSEMFPLLSQEKENTLELFQIWMNLPKRSKMVPAHFTMFWSEETPLFEAAKGVQLKLIAGEFQGKKAPTPPPDSWAFDPSHHAAIWLISLEPGSELELPVTSESDVPRMIYFFEGDVLNVGGESLTGKQGALLDASETHVLKAGASKAQVLVLQAKPIGEPVVQYGPFVMNTEAEIRQTMMDYQRTEFGGWKWGRPDMIHTGEGRFAKYPDGKIEKPKV